MAPGGADSGGDIDVAVIELDRAALPPGAQIEAFAPQHLLSSFEGVDLGHQLVVPCFPLSFHDTVHHLPIARQAALASSLGLRFQGHGYFLTDARMHRGASGAPVLLHGPRPRSAEEPLPWVLLGVHSARMHMAGRDGLQDEAFCTDLGVTAIARTPVTPNVTLSYPRISRHFFNPPWTTKSPLSIAGSGLSVLSRTLPVNLLG